jgi:hypothetical protein
LAAAELDLAAAEPIIRPSPPSTLATAFDEGVGSAIAPVGIKSWAFASRDAG